MSNAYNAIAEFYGDRTAERSGVKLIRHIDEGLAVLEHLMASDEVKDAYCLHPLYQDSRTLPDYAERAGEFSQKAILLVMEYRSTANAYLSKHTLPTHSILSPLFEVNLMLIADKVQNRKDFLKYHQGHANFARLDEYFKDWLAALGVDETLYQVLVSRMEAVDGAA